MAFDTATYLTVGAPSGFPVARFVAVNPGALTDFYAVATRWPPGGYVGDMPFTSSGPYATEDEARVALLTLPEPDPLPDPIPPEMPPPTLEPEPKTPY